MNRARAGTTPVERRTTPPARPAGARGRPCTLAPYRQPAAGARRSGLETSVVLEPGLGVEPEGVPRLARRELVLLLAAAAALQAIAWVVVYQVLVANKWGYVPWLGSDTALYADRGLRVTGGQWPYTEFPFEYPPLSLLFFVLPPLRSTLAVYHAWFGAQMIVIDALTAIVTTVVATRVWPGLARPAFESRVQPTIVTPAV